MGGDWTADKISKKFGGILKQLGFSEEEKEWFRSETSDKHADNSKTNRNYYIFGGTDAPDNLKKLFDILEEKEEITEEMITDVKYLLFNLLPVHRKKEDMGASYKNEQKMELDNLKKLFQQLKDLDILKNAQNKRDLSKQYSGILEKHQCQELVKISKMVQTCCMYSILKEEGSNLLMLLNDKRQKFVHIHEIEKRVEAYFADKFNPGYLEMHIFRGLQKKCNGKIWKDIYSELYIEIEEWHDKWMSVMDNALEIRESESQGETCGNCDLPQNQNHLHKLELYEEAASKEQNKEGNLNNRKKSSLNEKNKDFCYSKSERLVNEICGNKNPNVGYESLTETYKQKLENIKRFKHKFCEDFNYIKIRSFLELNNIRNNIERKQKEYCGVSEEEKKGDNFQTNYQNKPKAVDEGSCIRDNLFTRYS